MTRLSALLLLLACSDPRAGLASSGAPEQPAGSGTACLPARLPEEMPVSVVPPSSTPAGAACGSALPLARNGESALLVPMTGAAPALECAPVLGAAGAYFVLDLSAERDAVPVQLVFDAPVPIEVGLARGACGDLHVERCATSLYSDERSRVIS